MRNRIALLLVLVAATHAVAGLVDNSFGVVQVTGQPTLIESRFGGYYMAQAGRIERIRADGQFEAFSATVPVAKVLYNYAGTDKPSSLVIDSTLGVVGEDSQGRLILASNDARNVFYDLDASFDYTVAVLARLNRDGTLDRSFGQDGFARLRAGDWDGGPCYGNANFTKVVADGDNLYLAGTQAYVVFEGSFDDGFREVRNLTCALVVKVQDNGTLDKAFGESGWARPNVLQRSTLHGASLAADGSIVLTGMTSVGGGGSYGTFDPEYVEDRKFYRARISSSGASLDTPSLVAGPPLDANSIDYVGIMRSVGTSGWIMLTRYSSKPYEILRLDGQGRPVASFGNGGRVLFNETHFADFTILGATAEGGVYAFGTQRLSASEGISIFCRWLSDGTPDSSVGPNGCAELFTGRDRIWFAMLNRDGSVLAPMYDPNDPRRPQLYRVYRINATPDVVEFHNTILDHYFYTYDGAEARGIDKGAAGPGWVRTGQRFTSGGAAATCRFYSPGANTHFYTVEPSECEAVKRMPIFIYEGEGFWSTSVSQCGAGLAPVHRLFNNQPASPNHRFVKSLALSPPMTAKGWIQEGVAFCVRP